MAQPMMASSSFDVIVSAKQFSGNVLAVGQAVLISILRGRLPFIFSISLFHLAHTLPPPA
jgi:hypothetical protein